MFAKANSLDQQPPIESLLRLVIFMKFGAKQFKSAEIRKSISQKGLY